MNKDEGNPDGGFCNTLLRTDKKAKRGGSAIPTWILLSFAAVSIISIVLYFSGAPLSWISVPIVVAMVAGIVIVILSLRCIMPSPARRKK